MKANDVRTGLGRGWGDWRLISSCQLWPKTGRAGKSQLLKGFEAQKQNYDVKFWCFRWQILDLWHLPSIRSAFRENSSLKLIEWPKTNSSIFFFLLNLISSCAIYTGCSYCILRRSICWLDEKKVFLCVDSYKQTCFYLPTYRQKS